MTSPTSSRSNSAGSEINESWAEEIERRQQRKCDRAHAIDEHVAVNLHLRLRKTRYAGSTASRRRGSPACEAREAQEDKLDLWSR